MRLSVIRFLLCATLLSAAGALYAGETVKVRNATGRWEVSGDITLIEAEERALNEAKKDALRKAGVMENVWSVFGQVSTESGSEFDEAFSSVSVLALNGLVNITDKKTEDVWDPVAKKLFKVVTIDANVTKDDVQEDKSYLLEVTGIEPVYKESEPFTCTIRVHGADSYIKFFWFGEDGASMVYPNSYEENRIFRAGETFTFPVSDKIDLVMEKTDKSKEVEKVNIIIVATKKDFPYIGETDYQSILTWLFRLPADQRTFYYNMTLIR